jgi:hypothetical protein
MASEEHLKILQQGVAVWNEWRKKNPELHPDLGKAVLYRGSAHETESIPLTEYCPIFRVPEYSFQLPANLASAAEGVSLFRRLESGAKTCILPAIAVAINKRPLAPIQAAYPNVR